MNNEEKWEEALDKIDEKYTDSAAEEVMKHSGKVIELEEIIPEQAEPPSRFIRIIKPVMGIAAALAVVIGFGALLKANDLTLSELWEMRPSESTVTTAPPATEPITTSTSNTSAPESTQPTETTTISPAETMETITREFVSNDGHKYSYTLTYILRGTTADYASGIRDLKLELYSFTEDRVICSRQLEELNVVGNNIKIIQSTGSYYSVNMQVFPLPSCDLVYINIPHYEKMYTAQNQAVFITVKDGVLTDVKAPDGGDFFVYPHFVGAVQETDAIVIETDGNKNTAYGVDMEKCRFYEKEAFPIDSDDSPVVNEEFNEGYLEGMERFEVFENYFYGTWKSAFYGGDDETAREFSYYGDASFESWGSFERGFYEFENGWAMIGLSGGIGNLHYISKENPDIMYYYDDVGGVGLLKNSYDSVFVRCKNQPEYDFELKPGSIKYIGVSKLSREMGDKILREGIYDDNTTDDGGENWKKIGHMNYGEGKIYLNEKTDNKVRFSVRYYPENTVLDDEPPYPPMQYLTYTYEKINGEWKKTAIDKYDRVLETAEGMPTEFTAEKQEEIDLLNAEGGDYRMVISVQYFTDSTGRYYAYRRISTSEDLGSYFSEIYYFNGIEYELLGAYEDDAVVAFMNDNLFVAHNDYEPENKLYLECFSTTSIVDNFGITLDGTGISNFDCYDDCIVFTAYTSENPSAEPMCYVISADRHNPTYTEIDYNSLIVNSDKTGFKAVSADGKEIRCNFADEGLSEELWLLNERMESIYDILWGGELIVDMSNTINVDGQEYGFVYDYSLSDYFTETVTYSLFDKLLYEAPARLTSEFGYYAPEMTGSTPKKCISYEIIKGNEETAAVRYKVQYGDEVLTYIAHLVKTEDGWRFDNFVE